MHVVGAMAYVAALGLGVIGLLFVAAMTSYNGDTPGLGNRIGIKVGLLVIAVVVSSVPAFVGAIARRLHTAGLPWFVLAGLTAMCAFLVAVSASPVKAPTFY